MKLDSMDIPRAASAAEIIYDALRRAIIEGELGAGEPLRQDEIAGLFNVSRIPVREAISRLEENGLVQSVRFKGAVVSGLSAKEAREIQNLRALLEPEIIRHSVPNLSPEQLTHARECYQQFADSTDSLRWGELNRQFHAALYSACDMPYHLAIANNAMDRIDRYLRGQLLKPNGLERANADHCAILKACEQRDADTAARQVRAHILEVRDDILAGIDDA